MTIRHFRRRALPPASNVLSEPRPSGALPTCAARVPCREPGFSAPFTPEESERGDVPGWVLVTLMTAGLVIAIWAVAGPALIDVFNTAMSRITGM